ncbi:MAG: response regulator [Lachnospiraceae bacterium]|nr:response regulator [Lachnospiraceae bacterium]
MKRIKEILLVGRIDKTTDSIAELLKTYFHVQWCAETRPVFMSMMGVVKPDLILLTSTGSDMDIRGILSELRYGHMEIPVIVLGIRSDLEQYRDYLNGSRFQVLYRPVSDMELLDTCMERLGMDRKTAEVIVSGDKEHILVVDDNAMVLRSIKNMLEEDYSVAVASSATQALTAIGKHRPDLILLDYLMPVMDGKEVFKLIKADEKLRSIPVVFLTSVADKDECLKVLSLEPAGYILKPPVKKELLEYIRKALDEAMFGV